MNRVRVCFIISYPCHIGEGMIAELCCELVIAMDCRGPRAGGGPALKLQAGRASGRTPASELRLPGAEATGRRRARAVPATNQTRCLLTQLHIL
jgi:hypothetical protein